LIALHQIEVVIGLDAERRERLIEHVAMLRGDAHAGVHAGNAAQPVDDGSELDGLRAGAEDSEDAHTFIVLHASGKSTPQSKEAGKRQRKLCGMSAY